MFDNKSLRVKLSAFSEGDVGEATGTWATLFTSMMDTVSKEKIPGVRQ